MKKIKVVVIGAGSFSFGRGIIADLMASEELRELNLTVVLVDINRVALDRMYRFANLLKEYHKAEAEIKATTDRREALLGANYVITSVARRRKELWDRDFYVPLAFGFKQSYGENGGPGAVFHTMRSLHLMIPICRDMEKFCPDALLLNYTNPESRVCLGVNRLTNVRAIGLCHGIFDTLKTVAKVLEKPEEEIEVTIGGINHFHWVMEIHNKIDHQSLHSEFDKKIREWKPTWKLDSLTRHMYEIFGLLPFPVASHIGEYVSFAYDLCGPLYPYYIKEGISLKEEKPISVLSSEEMREVTEGKKSLTKEFAQPTRELAIPIICDIEFNRNKREPSINIPNDNLAVSNLPEDAIVEIPARIDAEGVHPVKVGSLPEAIAAMCRMQISIQNLLVRAYGERSKKLLLQALLIDPVIDSVTRTKKMMEELLRIQADFLPTFH